MKLLFDQNISFRLIKKIARDFLEFNTLYGSPPKIIWLRTGNLTTKHLAELIIHRRKLIRAFLEDSSREILQTHIEE
ncbi:hypothetical protein FGM00_00735 [Aggregatimonas sangjinii]|uniref:DUF5615 domain-containing protein n=1 Tax=Aggregatimonas sangjinii TaxID=2583587 RepID=A0A5B7SNW8_9FLAO|nr:hypothetical protein FGM00_00735 [Aggregatimonas sangjinii]